MLGNINDHQGGPNMSYSHIIDVIRSNSDDQFQQQYLHHVMESDPAHPDFISVRVPYSGYVDYIREVDGAVIVLSDSDQWCDEFGEDDGWTYIVFRSIEDYIDEVLHGKSDPVIFDEGYNTFDSCFKSAVFDMLQNSHMFNR